MPVAKYVKGNVRYVVCPICRVCKICMVEDIMLLPKTVRVLTT